MSTPTMKSIGDPFGQRSLYVVEMWQSPAWRNTELYTESGALELAWPSRNAAYMAMDKIYRENKAWYKDVTRKHFRVRLYARVEESE